MKILTLLLILVANSAYADAPCLKPTKRHASVHKKFLVMTGYPHGRPGYVVDHIVPLCACGLDTVENMQWQTATDAAIKDAQERIQCQALRRKGKKP